MIAKIKSALKAFIPAGVRLRLRELQKAARAAVDRCKDQVRRNRMKAENRRRYETEIAEKKAKLHLGCGDEYLAGYINIDFFNKSYADKRWRLTDLKLPDECCERVESYAVLEHLNYIEFYECLEECCRVLVPGGKLVFEIPEFEEYIKLWLAQDHQTRWSFEWFSPIWGGQWNDGQYHKAGYSFERVQEILKDLGFDRIIRTTPSRSYAPCLMQRVEAEKIALSPAESRARLEKRIVQFEKWGHSSSANKLSKKLVQLKRHVHRL